MTALERTLRAYVAQGSGLDPHHVIPGNDPGHRPAKPYASLLLREDRRRGYPIRRQLPNTTMTTDLVYRQAQFSLQFWGDGAGVHAEAFDLWAMSETGLLQAETAFANGRISHIAVIDGGNGYTTPPPVGIDGDGFGAIAEAILVRGAVSAIHILNRGTDYSTVPEVVIDGAAQATARGFGFRLGFPLILRRIDGEVSDIWEERIVVDLTVDYAQTLTQDTGIIDAVECELIMGDNDISRRVAV